MKGELSSLEKNQMECLMFLVTCQAGFGLPGLVTNRMPFHHESLWKPHSAIFWKGLMHSCLVFFVFCCCLSYSYFHQYTTPSRGVASHDGGESLLLSGK